MEKLEHCENDIFVLSYCPSCDFCNIFTAVRNSPTEIETYQDVCPECGDYHLTADEVFETTDREINIIPESELRRVLTKNCINEETLEEIVASLTNG